jgi:hypothetical protein
VNRFGGVVCGVVWLFAGTALAAGPSTHTRTLNITGIGAVDTNPSDVNAVSGACNFDSWVDQCSAGNNCGCLKITVSKASGSMDMGTQTVSNFFVTIDFGINPATEPAVGGGPNPKCNPFLAILTDTSSTEAKTLNAFGVTCHKVIGISSSNPKGTHVGDTLSGGWGISATPAPNPLAAGWGTLTGSDSKTTGATSVKFSGLVTE